MSTGGRDDYRSGKQRKRWSQTAPGPRARDWRGTSSRRSVVLEADPAPRRAVQKGGRAPRERDPGGPPDQRDPKPMLAGSGLRRRQRKCRRDRRGQQQGKEAGRRRGQGAGEESSRADKSGALTAAEEPPEHARESRPREDRQGPAPGTRAQPRVEPGAHFRGGA